LKSLAAYAISFLLYYFILQVRTASDFSVFSLFSFDLLAMFVKHLSLFLAFLFALFFVKSKRSLNPIVLPGKIIFVSLLAQLTLFFNPLIDSASNWLESEMFIFYLSLALFLYFYGKEK
ncbi:MAG: hypothetical protein PHS02_02660, partial [Candidatus ainarchaeum sp.]|nr:hypothetical protein [Candidatus ainarchaeum sp.]